MAKNILSHSQLEESGSLDPAALVVSGMLKRSAGNGFARNWKFNKRHAVKFEGRHYGMNKSSLPKQIS